MTSAHKRQMSANGTSGDNSLRGATVIRWQAPVAVYDAQDTSGCREAAGGGFYPGRVAHSRFALTSKAPPLGRELRAPGPFHQFPNPLTGVSSPLVRAGRQAVERIPPRRSGLPFLRFKTTNYLARQSTNRSPATAHFQCVSFATPNVATERQNEVHSSHEFGSPHDH